MVPSFPKSLTKSVAKKEAFSSLPIEYRPKSGSQFRSPVPGKTWHKITDSDRLPETESGYWRTNFRENISKTGTGTLSGRPNLFVPPPHGWFSSWLLNQKHRPSAVFSKSSLPMEPHSKEVHMARYLQWLFSHDGNWWVAPQNTAGFHEMCLKFWEIAPKPRKVRERMVKLPIEKDPEANKKQPKMPSKIKGMSRRKTSAPGVFGAWKEVGGKRFFGRSKWERNVGAYLQWLKEAGQIEDWDHEPKTFWFEGIKRGVCSYLPDFWVKNKNGTEEYWEVKGWMDPKSKTKLSRMKKYHPGVKLVLIDKKYYEDIRKKMCKVIPEWEF